MKQIRLASLVSTAVLSVALPAWAAPRGSAGFQGAGGFAGGAHPVSGGHFGGAFRSSSAFRDGSFRGAPAFRGSYFSSRTAAIPSSAPHYYYRSARLSTSPPQRFNRSVTRSTSPSAGRSTAALHQSSRVNSHAERNRAINQPASRVTNRTGSILERNRASNARSSRSANQFAASRQSSFLKEHASERHDTNWHRDWDRHHSHFHHNKVFVFVNGFWWGLDPWFLPYYAYDYYPYYDYGYGYNPYDYSYGNGYNYSANPYDYYSYAPYNDEDQRASSDFEQSTGNSTVSAVQSELARLGYYGGDIDGVLGEQTEAALARYQQDQNLSVSGTVDKATLESLGLK